MSQGEKSFSHALCRKACLQVIYAQAERRSASQPTKQPLASSAKPTRQNRPPTPASSVYVVDKVTDALADVVSAFICQVAISSSSRARHSGRINVTFYDVVNTLNAMSLTTQSTIRDIANYCSLQRVEFPLPIPQYPVLPSIPSYPTSNNINSTSDNVNANRKRPYIENWMPDIPPAHTFVSNPGVLAPVDRTSNVSGPEQRRRVEASLARLREAAATTASNDMNNINNNNISNEETVVAMSTSQNDTSNNNKTNYNNNDSNSNINPFMALPILMSKKEIENNAMDLDLEVQDTEVTQPREPLETENNVESNSDIIETKYTISDQKKARVDRILADSGTIMLSQAAGTNTNAANGPAGGTATASGGADSANLTASAGADASQSKGN